MVHSRALEQHSGRRRQAPAIATPSGAPRLHKLQDDGKHGDINLSDAERQGQERT